MKKIIDNTGKITFITFKDGIQDKVFNAVNESNAQALEEYIPLLVKMCNMICGGGRESEIFVEIYEENHDEWEQAMKK